MVKKLPTRSSKTYSRAQERADFAALLDEEFEDNVSEEWRAGASMASLMDVTHASQPAAPEPEMATVPEQAAMIPPPSLSVPEAAGTPSVAFDSGPSVPAAAANDPAVAAGPLGKMLAWVRKTFAIGD